MSKAVPALILILASWFLGPSTCRAAQAVEAGILPISLSQPLGYEEAFKGTGIFLSAISFIPGANGGVGVNFVKQGRGSTIGLLYRQYILGHPQLKGSSPDVADPANRPLVSDYRYYGLYLELGADIYTIQRDKVDDVEGTITAQSSSGVGLIGGAGFEYPVFSFLYTSAKISLLNSLGGPANQLLIQVGVGYPFDLF